jgi:endoglucanase
MAYLQQQNISSTYWAGGPWWDKYSLSLEPADVRATKVTGAGPIDRPQMLVVRQYPG